MKILLVNQNATVEKLVRLSAQKMGVEIEQIGGAAELSGEGYDLVLIDSDAIGAEGVEPFKNALPEAKIGLLHPKGEEEPAGFDLAITKPFLPTELVEVFTALQNGGSTDAFAEAEEDGLSDDGAMEFEPLDEMDSGELGDLGMI